MVKYRLDKKAAKFNWGRWIQGATPEQYEINVFIGFWSKSSVKWNKWIGEVYLLATNIALSKPRDLSDIRSLAIHACYACTYIIIYSSHYSCSYSHSPSSSSLFVRARERRGIRVCQGGGGGGAPHLKTSQPASQRAFMQNGRKDRLLLGGGWENERMNEILLLDFTYL